MSLLTRLVDPDPDLEEVKIPVHQFMAALSEYERGAPGVTLAGIAVVFNLTEPETTQLQVFLDNIDVGNTNRELVHDVLMLGEASRADGSGNRIYTIEQVKDRLGF